MTTVLTCYNEDLQRYNGRLNFSKERKIEIIDQLQKTVRIMGKSFRKLFPAKKYSVLDEIAYQLSGSGICTIGAEKLMEKCGIKSRTTVWEAVTAIKETGEILVCQLANNHAGKYVFVLKSHPNFNEIMREVFYIEVTAENNGTKQHNEHQNEHLQNAVSTDMTGLNEEKTSSILSNLSLSLKQELLTNIANAIENELLDTENEQQEEQRVNEYLSDRQKALYNAIKEDMNFTPAIKKYASVIALRASQNYVMGAVFRSLNKINRMLNRKEVIESIPAYFVEVYKDELRGKSEQQRPAATEVSVSQFAVPFYDWLNQ